MSNLSPSELKVLALELAAAMPPEELRDDEAGLIRLQTELQAIADGQKFYDALVGGLKEKGYDTPCNPELLSECVAAMRESVSYREIDDVARELFGERLANFSICDAYNQAKDVAMARKEAANAKNVRP